MGSTWSNSFTLNIPEIDNQHKKFFELFDGASSGFENKTPEQLERVIIELENYMEYHFQTEEKLMEDAGYESIENHKKQHSFFINRVKEMRLEFEYINPLLFEKITTFIKKWFVSHVIAGDPKFRDTVISYLNQNK